MKWYVIYQDGLWIGTDGHTSVFPTKKSALEELFISQLENRLRPNVKRLEDGFYIYTTSKKQEEWKTFHIVNEYQLKKQGFYNLVVV